MILFDHDVTLNSSSVANNELIPTPIDTSTASFKLTVWNSDNSSINKEIKLVDGKVVKSPTANMSEGSFKVITASTPEELNSIFNSLSSKQAVSIGTPHRKGKLISSGKVTSQENCGLRKINRRKM